MQTKLPTKKNYKKKLQKGGEEEEEKPTASSLLSLLCSTMHAIRPSSRPQACPWDRGRPSRPKEQQGGSNEQQQQQRQRYAISHMYLYPSDMKRINCGKTNCIRMRCRAWAEDSRGQHALGVWQLVLQLGAALEAKRQSNPGFAFYRNVATSFGRASETCSQCGTVGQVKAKKKKLATYLLFIIQFKQLPVECAMIEMWIKNYFN